ncbi:unsaturated rhamnogalacturonyl hydrolase YesR [Favolaschia claudopus]|uniref:Unsaturated rhamnogalacturonyl hydrolase YesR n=1 Tax=Favolaschia claudopus TaxID=2862362 RepID=A0AAW0EAG0_9AGAR
MVNPASLLLTCNANTSWNPVPFSPGFDIISVVSVAKALPSHSWEFGTASEALLELHDPELSVFGSAPFPVATVRDPETCVVSLGYAARKIVVGTGANALSDGEGAGGDPASLGVSAVLLGKSNATYARAVKIEIGHLMNSAPRFSNGAISHRSAVAELCPFLAYAAADAKDLELLHEAYLQCGLYRKILRTDSGGWKHIIGPENEDTGLWSTSNAWAAAGMARVLATIIKAPVAVSSTWRDDAVSDLSIWIQEILDGAMSFAMDDGLLRNYLDDTTVQGFGEISGTSLFAAVVYRMVVLQPFHFGEKYIKWADKIRATMALHISSSGIAAPAVNPMDPHDTVPLTSGSPEGNLFVVLMYASWRDCVLAKVCNLQ